MYQILCDGYTLYDPRLDDMVVINPKCKLAVNSVNEGSFTILKDHPNFQHMQKLKSVFEIKHDNDVIFRGRMTEDSRDFYNQFDVDLEGALAYANDTQIPPFDFPKDFTSKADYITASKSGNVVAYFLNWVIEKHNEHVSPWQKFKLGNVTVSDPNNYITRKSESYASTFDTLKDKLFESALGGYLYVRYESDGNYIDYLDAFPETNTQRIHIKENILDIKSTTDATSTFSAILPLGAEVEVEVSNGTYEGDYVEIEDTSTVKVRISLDDMPDGAISDDLVKKGKYVYSKSAVEKYGWICVPPDESTFDDVETVSGLLSKTIEYMANIATTFLNTITIKAVDTSFTDDEIEAFRMYRNVVVDSPPHGIEDMTYPLTELDIDISNPSNTTMVVGDEKQSLIDYNKSIQNKIKDDGSKVKNELSNVGGDIAGVKNELSDVKDQNDKQTSEILKHCETMVQDATEPLVNSTEFGEYQKLVSTQMQLTNDEVVTQFAKMGADIEEVKTEINTKLNDTVWKYFTFDAEDGLTIGEMDNPYTMVIDNDDLKIVANGDKENPIQTFDASGRALIPELNVTKTFNLFSLTITEDSTHINCDE